MEINIQQKAVTATFIFDKLYINAINVIPFQKATLHVRLHFTDPTGIANEVMRNLDRVIELTSDEYNNWTTDEYLIDLLLIKLNLVKA